MRNCVCPRIVPKLVLAAITFVSVTMFYLADKATAAQTYQVGVAKVDITPEYPIRLNGFGGRRAESEGITQPIWAKALAINANEQQPIVIIAIDSLGIRESMVDEVARRLKDKVGLPRDRLVVTFSHSHTTPKVAGACDTIFSSPIPPEHQAHIDRYTKELTDALEQVALAALKNRESSLLSWGVGTVKFAINRRTPGGPVDHDLPVLVVKSADNGKLRAIYTSYACHCVTLSNNKISGDWSGFAQVAIERTHPGVIGLVSVGCGSDSNPSSGVTGDNTAVAADQGSQILQEIDRLLQSDLKPIAGPISATLAHIELPLNPPPTRAALEQLTAADNPAGYNAKFQLSKLDRGESLLTSLDYPIQTFSFGDSLSMVFLGGEICVDYSLRLKEELDAKRIWLNGYSNDFCAYIPSERLLKEGGYGGGAETVYFALPNTLAQGLEEKIIAEVHKQSPPQFQGKGPRRQASAQPWPLDEALASIIVEEGFVVEVAAAEPLVSDPVAIDFGPDGRLWVAEMTDYSRFADEEFTPNGTVRVLTDRDGDGRYDSAKTYVEGLRFPTDVKAWGAGVLVCDAPDVIYYEDTDGDGKADLHKVLLTGFATHNAQARVNSLRWGLDNWLYGACGIFGGNITTSTGKTFALGERDFRFQPDCGTIQAVTGRTQQGRARDDWGNWFGCENSSLTDHYPLNDTYLSRNPHVTPPPGEVSVFQSRNSTQLHPQKGAPTMFALSGPAGRPTSVCGLDIYRDDLLGPDFSNNVFVAEPVNELVHRTILTPHQSTFEGKRGPKEETTEFLSSTDPWFRPVQLRTGLDGCLYVVDMHRAVIEHQKFIPAEDLKSIDVTAGREQGRIYRVRPKNVTPRQAVRLDLLNDSGLVQALDSPNGPQRDLAQQLLVRKQAHSIAKDLEQLVQSASRPATRLQALCTLDGLKALDSAILLKALQDHSPAVRRHAIRLSEPHFNSDPMLAEAVLECVDDDDPQVRLQLAYTLGELADPQAAHCLVDLLVSNSDDPYLVAAAWSSVNPKSIRMVTQLLVERASENAKARQLVEPAVALLTQFGSNEDLAAIARELHSDNGGALENWKFASAARLLDVARTMNVDARSISDSLIEIVSESRHRLEAGEGTEQEQLDALLVLAASGSDEKELLPLVSQLLEPRYSPAVQQSAFELLSSFEVSDIEDYLAQQWHSLSPRLREQALELLLSTAGSTNSFLDKIGNGGVAVSEFNTLQRQRLLTHSNEKVRAKAAAVFSGVIDPDRARIVKEYVKAIAPGDPALGRQLFAKHCTTCHQLEGQGHEVGPNLSALTGKSQVALVESILNPNEAVDERYRNYLAVTDTGLARTGLLSEETSTAITLTGQEGKKTTILRDELESLETNGKSLMPEGFERDLTPSDLNNLLAYMELVRPQAKSVAGNKPQLVTPDNEGTLWLRAEVGEIYGEAITFENPFRNIGYWNSLLDHVTWSVSIPRGGDYEVYVEWACPESSANNVFAIEGGSEVIQGKVDNTGGYDVYKVKHIGRMTLASGERIIDIHPAGPHLHGAMMDLRGLYLLPVGKSANRILTGGREVKTPEVILQLKPLLEGLDSEDRSAQYAQINDIWQAAIAAGRRNDEYELRCLIELALPERGEALEDWQVVALGGGVVNGLSQAGDWPGHRLEYILANSPELSSRWNSALASAVKKAQNSKVPRSTRYDALRMLAAANWQQCGKILSKYVAHENHELQMGAVSSLSDHESNEALTTLLGSLATLSESNLRLAIAGFLRTPQRAQSLRNALELGKVTQDLLTEKEIAQLDEMAPSFKPLSKEKLADQPKNEP